MMKKLILIALVIFGNMQGYSYTWQSYGLEGITATNLYFYNGFGEEEIPLIIMSDSGFYLRDETLPGSWLYFAYPMKDAVLLNETTILFVSGNGSYSDGIYSLYIPSGQIDVVQCCQPNIH